MLILEHMNIRREIIDIRYQCLCEARDRHRGGMELFARWL